MYIHLFNHLTKCTVCMGFSIMVNYNLYYSTSFFLNGFVFFRGSLLCSCHKHHTIDQNPNTMLVRWISIICIDDRIDDVEIAWLWLDWVSRLCSQDVGRGWYVGQSLNFNLSLPGPDRWALINSGCCLLGGGRMAAPEYQSTSSHGSHATTTPLLQYRLSGIF